ncbi:MAG TPA: cytochrome c oxidase subunit I [Devosia sp.]|nr:cytochrome c oxidase subunit I [Devosia sp.]
MNREPMSPVALHKALAEIWDTPPGWGRLSSVNHNIVGKRFMIAALVFFSIGGTLAMLIRAQLATAESAFIGPDLYNQIFTMHGTVMMFLFAIPMFEGLAIYLLPKLLGARDLAFPRITAYGFWCYIFGGTILITAMVLGYAPDAGWFMYTPLSSDVYSPGINSDVWLLGITFVEISAITAAIEIMVTVLKMRAPGMSIDRMPIFAWYMIVTSGMMIFGFPPLILGSILLEMERAFGLPFFDPERGGDPLLWQHLFWLFGHPEVYIIFLPAAGVLSTIIPTFAQRPLIAYRAVVAAIVAMGFLSFGLWVHHMFTVGIPHMALAFFSAASALVAVPTAIQIFVWIGTLSLGRPKFDVPMLYVLGFFFVFVIGGLTGVMLAMVPFNSQAHDTHFVVAHLHYVLVGGFVFPMLAGLYYWLPHFTGRTTLYRMSVPAFWLIFIGFNLTFFLMHLTGLMGMPRRISTYPSNWGWDWLNLLSSIGGFLSTVGFALVLVDIILQFRFGRREGINPWGARTLEWATPLPPPSYNFASIPHISGRADDLDTERLGRELASGEGYLSFAREGRQETLGVDMLSGEPEHVIILPNSSFVPLYTALATGVFFLSLLFKVYWLAPVGVIATVVMYFIWARSLGAPKDVGALDVGRGVAVPLDAEVNGNVTGWANLFAVGADATLYASLLFGALFLLVVAPGWEGRVAEATPWWIAAPAVASLAAAVMAHLARRANAYGKSPMASLVGSMVLHGVVILGLAYAMYVLPDPTSHANPALRFAILLYGVVHASVAALLALQGVLRCRGGYLSPRRATTLNLVVLWTDFAAATLLVGVGFVYALAMLGGSA